MFVASPVHDVNVVALGSSPGVLLPVGDDVLWAVS